MSTKSIKRRIVKRWLAKGFARVAQDGRPPNHKQLTALLRDYRMFKAGGIDAVRAKAQVYIEWIIDEANEAEKEERDGRKQVDTAVAETARAGTLAGGEASGSDERAEPAAAGDPGADVSDPSTDQGSG